MCIQEKLKEFAQLEEKAEKLRIQIAGNKEEKESLERELSHCRSQRLALDEASKHIRNGIIWLAIGVVLVILEVMCLTETLIVGYNDFELIDLVIILIPLICAIVQFSKGGKIKKFGSDEELAEKIRMLLEKISVFEHPENQLEEIEEEMEYKGQNWDLSTFRGDSNSISQLEQDLEDLLVVLKHNDCDTDFVNNCWLATNEMRASIALLNNDTATQERYSHVGETIRATGCWSLLLINACNISLMAEIAKIAVGGNGEGIPFAEAVERIHMRKPENPEEQALWDLAHEVIPELVFKVGYGIKKAMGKQ